MAARVLRVPFRRGLLNNVRLSSQAQQTVNRITPGRALLYGTGLWAAVASAGLVGSTTIPAYAQPAHTSSSTSSSTSTPPQTTTTTTTATEAEQHWARDADGINAQQKQILAMSVSDPLSALIQAPTRHAMTVACSSPQVVDAKLQSDQSTVQLKDAIHTLPSSSPTEAATSSSTEATPAALPADELTFLTQMEREFGPDVLAVLRRQQWSIRLAPQAAANTSSTTSSSSSSKWQDKRATLVCYFQEGTQRILWRRLELQ